MYKTTLRLGFMDIKQAFFAFYPTKKLHAKSFDIRLKLCISDDTRIRDIPLTEWLKFAESTTYTFLSFH